MRLMNFTSIDSNWLKEVIRFCKPNGITNFDISFKNKTTSGCHGYCYWAGCSYHKTGAPLITIRIGDEEKFIANAIKRGVKNEFTGEPLTWNHLRFPRMIPAARKKAGYLPYLALNKEEEIIHVIAHELRHLWQAKVKSGHRVWGARGRFSERDADAYGIRKVREWRREHMEELW